MQTLPDSIADWLWPGCATVMETQPMRKRPEAMATTRITLTHPDNPITITYTFEQDQDQADITASGLHQASYKYIQSVMPVIRRLRDFTSEPKRHKTARTDYDRAFQRIEEGEDSAKVQEDFIAETGVTAKAFHAAMYRRRESKKRKPATISSMLEVADA